MIPGINGEQLLLDIRATKQMPIIVITAKLDKQLKLDLLRAGADDYIIKPFDLEEVSARVYSNIRRYLEFSNCATSTDKLTKANPMEEYIETIWGMGYRLKG